MTEKRFKFIHDSVARNLKTPICDNSQSLTIGEVLDKMNELSEENEQLKHFIQKLTTKGTAKIHLANGSIYNVNAILTDFKGDFE